MLLEKEKFSGGPPTTTTETTAATIDAMAKE